MTRTARYDDAVGNPSAETVTAAQRGDQDALEELLSFSLPLVYNIIGHSLRGHADVDDVVQESMLGIVRGLPQLRKPTAFRSWVAAVAIRQLRWHYAERAQAPQPTSLASAPERPDPAGDFVDVCVLRLGLSGQRREVAEATRWLDEADQELLALWWLEAAGSLKRTELANALEVTTQHAAVRVQRMRQQLDLGRVLVRSLNRTPRCAELSALAAGWNGMPSPLWRKRLGRHVRSCTDCGECARGLMPADGLLVGLGLVPVAVVLSPKVLQAMQQGHATNRAVRTVAQARRLRLGRLSVSTHAAVGVTAVVAAAAVATAVVSNQQPTRQTASAAQIKTLTTTSTPTPTITSPAAPTQSTASAAASVASSAASSAAAPKTSAAPHTSAAAVLASPATSTKKGAATWNFSGIDNAFAASGVSWYYNWAADPQGISSPRNVQFVPMMWGANSVTSANLTEVEHEGGDLLGFNEPDSSSQANMTPQQALDLWPKLMATGLTLGSPAVAVNAATPGGWLDQFMQGAKARGYRVDFITVHWYGSDFTTSDAVSQLESYIQAIHARYDLPIWLTEYALISFSGSTPTYPSAQQQAAFVSASTSMLQGLSYVQRYSWFAFPATTPGQSGLFQPGGAPNLLGQAYEAAGS